MKSLWSDAEAAQFPGDLGQRVYTSRLLGRDKSLVLHGGGNTSVKIDGQDLFGRKRPVLHVKGSGWDLELIEEAGFSPVRLDHLVDLSTLEALSDPQMVNEMRTHMLRADAPTPSVEAILHAILPFKYVDHTHSDAVLALTNTADGERRIRALYGDDVVVIPYVMPGFDLARLCARIFPRDRKPATIGMVLLNHGIFSFGDTARESYERMITLVDRAERALDKDCVPAPAKAPRAATAARGELATLRREVSRVAGNPMIVASHTDEASLAFAQADDVASIARRGPATPDHVLRTKRIAMVGRDVDAFAREYAAYFNDHAPAAREPKTMLDAAPAVLVRGQKTASKRAGKLPLAAMANARPTMNATFCPLNTMPRPIAMSARHTVAMRATRNSSPGLGSPRRITLAQMSCEIAAAPDSARPATTARIVAKATAAMNPRNGRPPSNSASSGAAMLPPASTARIASGPTSTIAPNPRMNVSR